MTNYYQVEKVNQHILAIKSLGGEFVYLILGKKRALFNRYMCRDRSSKTIC